MEMNIKFWQRGNRSRARASGGRPSTLGFWKDVQDDEQVYAYQGNRGVRNNGAIVSCVQKIVSRAIEIPFMSENRDAQRVLSNPSWLKSLDPVMFWRRLYETVLYDGDAAVYRASSGLLRIGRTQGVANLRESGGMTLVERTFRTKDIGDVNSVTLNVSDADVCRINWVDNEGWTGKSPYEVCRKDADAYQEAMDGLYQEVKFARRISGEIDVNEWFNDKAELEEALKEFNDLLKSGRKNLYSILHKGVNFKPSQHPASPPHEELLTQSLAGVARVYGVPLQLLGAGDGMANRLTVDEADAHLTRDAVQPIVRQVAGGLSRILDAEVKPDMRNVALPSKTGMAGLTMQLAQSGVLTVNDIRRQIGFEPLEDERGDQFPQTAGAAERDNGGKSDDTENQD